VKTFSFLAEKMRLLEMSSEIMVVRIVVLVSIFFADVTPKMGFTQMQQELVIV
jgi:hypothetical protein